MSKTFEIKFDCTNSAFDEAPEYEIARILHELASRIENQEFKGYDKYSNVKDINGNIVGTWRYK